MHFENEKQKEESKTNSIHITLFILIYNIFIKEKHENMT